MNHNKRVKDPVEIIQTFIQLESPRNTNQCKNHKKAQHPNEDLAPYFSQ